MIDLWPSSWSSVKKLRLDDLTAEHLHLGLQSPPIQDKPSLFRSDVCLKEAIYNNYHHYYHQFLNRECRWGATDDFAASFLHFPLFSTALWDLPNSRLVHSLMLSSHLFLCLPCLLPSFTVPCKMVLAWPDELETWPSSHTTIITVKAHLSQSFDSPVFVRLMRSLVTSIFLYAYELWTLTAQLQRRIQAMEMGCYRKIL